MLKKIFFVLLLAVVGFVIYVQMQPDEYRVERSAVMAAPPAEVFAQVNDFHNWDAWSPWIKLDPNAKTTFEGPSSGQGAIFRWAGNAEVGEGSMTILESKPNELVRIQLDFVKPMEGTAITEFNLRPEGSGTHTTWSMHGKNNFVGKLMCSVFSMDKMIGGNYEEGLAKMKKIVESDEPAGPALGAPAPTSPAPDPTGAATTRP